MTIIIYIYISNHIIDQHIYIYYHNTPYQSIVELHDEQTMAPWVPDRAVRDPRRDPRDPRAASAELGSDLASSSRRTSTRSPGSRDNSPESL